MKERTSNAQQGNERCAQQDVSGHGHATFALRVELAAMPRISSVQDTGYGERREGSVGKGAVCVRCVRAIERPNGKYHWVAENSTQPGEPGETQ
jgi:hypothetical protein